MTGGLNSNPEAPPLQGVRVLDFCRYVAGPFTTMLLADAGAEVIKVEPIGGEVGRKLDPMIETPVGIVSAYFHRLNRSKKSISIDIFSDEGRGLVLRLLRSVDVVVENFRPGVMSSLGLGYEELRQASPRIIYCSISGYGHTPSPHRDDPAFAILAEVSAGVVARRMHASDPPTRLSAPVGDLFPAALATAGIGMALWKREQTGEGSHIDMAMYDALVSLNEGAVGMSATTGQEASSIGPLTYVAPFGFFKAADGYICIAVVGEKVWRRFCTAIGRQDLADDPALGTGSLRAQAIDGVLGQAIDEWLNDRTGEEAIRTLVSHGVPAGRTQTPSQVVESEQTRARDLLWDVPSYSGRDFRLVRSPIRFRDAPFAPVTPVPELGRDTAEILSTLGGFSDEEIRLLASRGIIEVSPGTFSVQSSSSHGD